MFVGGCGALSGGDVTSDWQKHKLGHLCNQQDHNTHAYKRLHRCNVDSQTPGQEENQRLSKIREKCFYDESAFHIFKLMKRVLRSVLLKHFYQHLFVSFIQQKLLHRTSAKCGNKLKSTPGEDKDARHPSQSIKKWRRFNNHNQGHPRTWMNISRVCELFMSMFQLPRWIKRVE